MIESGLDPNSTYYVEGEYEDSNIPIIAWAENAGKKSLVKLLIDKGAIFEGNVGDYNFSIIPSVIEESDFDTLKLLIEKGLKLDIPRKELKDLTITTWAIKNNYDDIAKLAIEKKATLTVGELGSRSVDLLIANKKIDLLKIAVESGLDINMTLDKENNQTLLTWAISNSDVEFVKYLCSKKVDVNKVYKNGMTALMIAAQIGNTEIVKALLEANSDISIKNNEGKTADFYAKTTEIKKLLNPSYTMNIIIGVLVVIALIVIVVVTKSLKGNKTKLLKMIKSKEFDKAIALINKGTSLEIKDENGKNALFYAIDENNIELIKLLLEKGTNINSINSKGETALNYAIESSKDLIVRVLIELGANTSIRNIKDLDAIALSILNNQKTVAEELILKGVSLYNKYSNGKSLLHLACEMDNINAVKFLVEKEFDVNINDSIGKTPFSYALSVEVKTILQKAGATY